MERDMLKTVADLWSTYLKQKVSAVDVAVMAVMLFQSAKEVSEA